MFERDIMSIDFNTGKVNSISNADNTTGFKFSTPVVNGAGNSNIIKVKINNQFLELLKALGIDSPEDIEAILKKCQTANIDINNISNEELSNLVNDYKAVKISDNIEVKDNGPELQTVDNREIDSNETTNKTDFKSEYNNKDLKGKVEDCYVAIARNVYKHGFEDKNGNYILKPNNLGKSWEELSDAEQQQCIQKIKDFIDKDEKLKSIKEQFASSSNISEEEKMVVIDTLMRSILASDFMDIPYTEYLKKDVSEREDIIYQYLDQNKESLNQNDNYYFENYKNIRSKISEILEEKFGIDTQNLDARDISKYTKYCNIDKDEVFYLSLKEKAKEGTLEGNDKILYDKYSKIYDNEKCKDNIRDIKAQNIHDLEIEYNQLKSKSETELTSEERMSLKMLERIFNPKPGSKEEQELKELKNLYESMPEPNEEEKVILNEAGSMLENIRGHIQGSALEANLFIREIDKKFAGRPDEKEKFIKTFLNYNKSAISTYMIAYYQENGESKYMTQYTSARDAMFSAQMNKEQTDRHNDNIVLNGRSENPYLRNQAHLALQIGREILPKSDNEYAKDKYIGTALDVGNSEDRNGAIDVGNSIKDDGVRESKLKQIYTHQNTTVDNAIYGLQHIEGSGSSQGKVLEWATGRFAEAAVWASENNTIARMNKEYQTKGFETLHSNINKHFDGEDAIKYSKSLADQIQNCDKSNQLDMHKEIMTSKYSEVIEHAAGNIKNYDASVQPEAIESVIATGNTRAVETAFTNLASSPSVVQDSVKLRAIIETSFENSKVEELAQKVKSGAVLTREEYNSLSEAQKQEYKAAYFKSLSPAKQIEIITKISDVHSKKAIFKKIAQFNSNLLKNIIEHDAASAEFVYDMHIADDLVLSVAKRKSASVIQFANLAKKIEKSNLERNRNSEITEQSDKKDSDYMDSPFDALKLQNKKRNNIYFA